MYYVSINKLTKSHIHSVPKTKQSIGPRINLTFRNVVTELVSKQPKPAVE